MKLKYFAVMMSLDYLLGYLSQFSIFGHTAVRTEASTYISCFRVNNCKYVLYTYRGK